MRDMKRKEQAERTEAELKAAAVRVFERVGYLNAKITEITAEAGRATGSFYKHFASKEKLLEALLADLLAEGDESAELPGHGTDFADRDTVRWHVALYWGFYRRHRTVMEALRQAAIVDPAFARVTREMLEPDLRHLAGHLPDRKDPLVLASIFTSVLAGVAESWYSSVPLGSDDAAIEALTSFIHGGLRAMP